MFKVLTRKFSYVEHFALMDGRLVLCGLAVSVAMFALLWDWLNPFPLSRYKYHKESCLALRTCINLVIFVTPFM